MREPIRSGDAVVAFDEELNVVSWNAAAEELTGIAAGEAIGRPCWDVLGADDERGSLVCHPGCSGARLAREGFAVPCHTLRVKTAAGRRLVDVSTIAVDTGEKTLFLHLLRDAAGGELPQDEPEPRELTPRQHQVLGLLAEGVKAKAIALRLELSEVTVRNHIHAILSAFGAHSQLEAVAEARRRGVL